MVNLTFSKFVNPKTSRSLILSQYKKFYALKTHLIDGQ